MESRRSNVKPWIIKKRAKFRNILQTRYNITANETPQNSIVWCNGGHSTGISKEEMVRYFSRFGVIESFVSIPEKSHCFIKYRYVESAIKCYNICQDKYLYPKQFAPMCLLYADKIPDFVPFQTFLPTGCILHKDFVTPEEESTLLEFSDYKNNNDWFLLKQRKVKQFGYEYIYTENCAKKFDTTQEIPKLCEYFWDRIKSLGYPLAYIPDQLTINCYEPGQGIPPHIDTHSVFDHTIYIISLNSDIQMEFKQGSDVTYVHVPRRSLLILEDAARFSWNHGINSRPYDVYFIDKLGFVTIDRGTRISFTFRRVRQNPCCCNFPQHCDSRITDNVGDDSAAEIENRYVKETYDNIADHFSATRYKPWRNVYIFVGSFPPGSLLLDIGCGNGKYFGYCRNNFEIGCELCPSLAQICNSSGFAVINANCLRLPFKDNMFDGIICIAVLHHLSTINRRRKAITEILRVLARSGRALLYVWADQQVDPNISKPEDDVKIQNLPVNESNLTVNSKVTLPIIANDGRNFQSKDILVPWTHNIEKKTYLRYYHIFGEEEFEELVSSSGGEIIQTFHDMGNWCIELTK